MPIYAYRCEACGHAQDVLQKLSDAPLTECPSCGAPAFKKQLTAAGFQLKGSGWYATDFRNKGSTTTAATGAAAGESAASSSSDAKPSGGSDSGKSEASGGSGAGGACNPGCACH